MTFDRSFIESSRAALEDRREAIVQRNREKIAEMLDLDAERLGDSIDITTAEQTEGTELRLQARLRALLHDIDDALARIDDDEYGECQGCGGEITEERMRAYPTASSCVECKEQMERTEARRYKRPGLMDEFTPEN